MTPKPTRKKSAAKVSEVEVIAMLAYWYQKADRLRFRIKARAFLRALRGST